MKHQDFYHDLSETFTFLQYLIGLFSYLVDICQDKKGNLYNRKNTWANSIEL